MYYLQTFAICCLSSFYFLQVIPRDTDLEALIFVIQYNVIQKKIV